MCMCSAIPYIFFAKGKFILNMCDLKLASFIYKSPANNLYSFCLLESFIHCENLDTLRVIGYGGGKNGIRPRNFVKWKALPPPLSLYNTSAFIFLRMIVLMKNLGKKHKIS